MAGHSKWANMKHRKARQDAKKNKIFTKIIRELTVAARLNPDVTANPRLRLAVDKALSENMTRDTIDRAIKRGAGANDGENYEELVYEGYGPNGVAVIVETMTDNHKRTVADVRHAFTKAGGSLGTSGSVAYLFTRRGVLVFAPGADEDALMEAALEAGAEDVVTDDDGSIEVFTTAETFSDVKDALNAAGFIADSGEVTLVPATRAEVDADHVAAFFKMLDQLEDCDDVQNVYHNADISDELMAEHS
ncbi:MAG: YebC/PmpR family DNA-binding transcriptional regulator [Alteromonadaceae bacterium]|jgi:YebC/PmpR family DNA-binding regulatory protein|uniref:YebC/PmpR family DNA-binding transcriptional regulator n=1 Tax=Rheinheimera TaxID=67575 RepID=UPI000C43A236|nr:MULTISPECIES: YebC/PmpR family DNA-binding transcriptional regulator [Rheinheimera]MBJ91329.1 YebC/PmpR family DNA-binding transcriptional regulator [Alteromonadaceae bacterium]MCD1597842.1 YebC/PmpR family DNA-binding transcriptional regulator [Rheinheimera aquimaris]HBN88671.1 YebC/PmpR family DNA-binding transcriptional regulator [Rheinheimera sp.]|tara:strand:+ start:156 stop:899 length:744 start_codon:yes stop_codon:yes gene_type:complete